MVVVRELDCAEISGALALARRVFLRFVAPDYEEAGVETFLAVLQDTEYLERLRFYGAFLDNTLVGMLGVRKDGRHIALFFVEGVHQRSGIGKRLFSYICRADAYREITVNAAPRAVAFYKKLGFRPTDCEQLENGIRFVPMTYYRVL